MKKENSHLIMFTILGLFLIGGFFLIRNLENNKEITETLPVEKPVNIDLSNYEEEDLYELDIKKWGIYNNGTHPQETTKGFNDALIWASKQGYSIFYVPAGTYLISKGDSETDPDGRINLVSDITFLMDEKAVIQKEQNGFEIYSTLYLGPDVENVTIKGGTLRGDRENHDFSQKGEFTEGSHEWGNGINTAGARNVMIDSVTIEKFTGDGIEIGGTTIYGEYITDQDLELGGINNSGTPVEQKGKVRSNNYEVTNFNNTIYQNSYYRNLMMWIPEGVEGTYDLFYYRKDGSFIEQAKNQRFNSTWGYSVIPDDADYFRVVFNAASIKNIKVNRMTVAITKNITIQNCKIGYNRRQGITVGASDDVKILNNIIHDTEGTAPESGIDIEPGFYPAINTVIKGNKFLNNMIHMVFSYGGNATVEENYFGPNEPDGLGFSINPAYYGATVKNNDFDHSSFDTWGNTKFQNNKLNSSSISFEGGSNVLVSDINGVDSTIGLTQTEENGISVKNIKLTSDSDSNSKGGIYVYGKPIVLENVSLTGNNELSGEGNSANTYTKLKLIATLEMNLPPGEYSECSINDGILSLNYPDKFKFNNCKFINTFIYTYNEKTEVLFQDSNFEATESIDPIILVLEAKNISVVSNSFNIETNKEEASGIIQIGRDASDNEPTKVFNVEIIKNKIISNFNRIGIDTTNGGRDKNPYIIENNELINTDLRLGTNDVNRGNKLTKDEQWSKKNINNCFSFFKINVHY